VDRGGEPAKIALGLLKLTVPFPLDLKQIDKADAKSLYESSAATDYRAAVTVSPYQHAAPPRWPLQPIRTDLHVL
jgi:hypothetical protein